MMSRAVMTSLILAIVSGCVTPGSPGRVSPDNAAWTESLLNPPKEMTQLPFWFWNDRLDEAEIKRQMADFRDHGVYGFVIHARMGLPKDIPYMGRRWLDLARAAVEEARRTGMIVHLYDEGMYPSGSAHGEIVRANPAFAARGLAVHVEKVNGPATVKPATEAGGRFVAAVVAEAAAERGVYDPSTFKLRTTEGSIHVPAGRWQVFTFLSVRSNGKIRGVHVGEDDGQPNAPAAADLLNSSATRKFIDLCHDVYYRELKDHFGETVQAIFTDEPSMLGRGARRSLSPWTNGFAGYFKDRFGYDLRPMLPALWFDVGAETERIRTDYRRALTGRLNETYYQPLGQWAADHGIALTGHPAHSDESEPLRYFQLPGQDMVWRWVLPNHKSMLEGAHSTVAKCASSVARHDRRRRCGMEMLGAYGWQLTFDEIKWLTDWMMIRGIDLIWPHAFYYSVRGDRIHERPPDVGPNNLWWPYYGQYAAYTARLSWILTDAEQVCSVAVLARDGRLPWRPAKFLFQHQVDFNYVEPDRLLRSSRSDGGLRIGPQTYDTIVVEGPIPADGPVAQRLRRFRDHGGRVISDADLTNESLETGLPIDVMLTPPNQDLRYRHMRKDGVDYYLLANEGEEHIGGRISVTSVGKAVWFDPWVGSFTHAAGARIQQNGRMRVPVRLDRRQLLVLCVGAGRPNEVPQKSEPERMKLQSPKDWEICNEDGRPLGSRLGDWRESEETTRFVGTLTYKTAVSFATAPAGRYILDLGRVGDIAELFVNGHSAGVRLWSPYRWDITSGLKPGENQIRMAVTNSRANELTGRPRPSGILGPVQLLRFTGR